MENNFYAWEEGGQETTGKDILILDSAGWTRG